MKQKKVPMLSKHAEKLGGTQNVPVCRDFIIKAAESVLRYSVPQSTLDVVKDSVNYQSSVF